MESNSTTSRIVKILSGRFSRQTKIEVYFRFLIVRPRATIERLTVAPTFIKIRGISTFPRICILTHYPEDDIASEFVSFSISVYSKCGIKGT